ncbi:class I SAM-dependent methyltransferase [Rhodopseudomonas palustris]|uniref:class I SAM-dependent methyltransferase n=1 Tax=Rhodopseudomonas palustris TaxID=1076 RepID=UPI0020CE0DB2|nr:class I SAM-dependent methyltransferase [Rhodopseudomonas palustris]MCP9627206.1 class I SAM-dependent methyltransferase [Rhodopseudomonas palustris]
MTDTANHVCRHCGTPLRILVADLGSTPIANDYLSAAKVDGPEPFYPLRTFVCDSCRLVQLQNFFRSDDLFREDYAYFSSYSTSWLAHAERYTEEMRNRFSIGPSDLVVEIASNDGYLLQYFHKAGIPVLGIEPSASVAKVAQEERGIPTVVKFFGAATAQELVASGKRARLTAANNVLAHVPDINDFVKGFAILLADEGVATFEFPHVANMLELNQFDTIYHEHFSYLSLLACERIFAAQGLRVFDVQQLPTHGGSLRLFACRKDAGHSDGPGLAEVRDLERRLGLDTDAPYLAFAEKVRETKRAFLSLLIDLKRQGKSIAAYGAPAKGNTLLNYCGVGADMIDFTVDMSPHKQGMFLPGTRLPILAPQAITGAKPDYLVILPWNLEKEITAQMAVIADWGGKFIIPIPTPKIVDAFRA